MTMTYDERRARRLTDYDHTHTPDGHSIPDVQTAAQDAHDVEPCCGRTVPTPSATTAEQPWRHAIGCDNYQPHPASIAATV